MSGDLILPRVRVTWGDINLSAYNGKGPFPQGAPLVYNVNFDLTSQTQGPTAQMKWDPTGPGFAEYEKFISSEEYMKSRIYVEFFYNRGKRIRLPFVWSGQSIMYGNDMAVTVMMVSELAGMINSNIRNATQAFDEKKGASYLDSINRGIQQFSVNGNLVRYNSVAKRDLEKAKLVTNYSGSGDKTFGSFISSTVQQNGNVAFPNNIEEPNVSIFPPFSWGADKDKPQDVKNGATEIPVDTSPKPEVRYGYIIGPSIINSLERKSEWISPQQDTQNKPGAQTIARDAETGRFVSQKPATAQQNQSNLTAKPTTAVVGTANARANPGIRNKDNPDGPKKQELLQQEGTASLSFQTLMMPVLVGIKPFDILYVPSLKGDYIEDWIVESVSYDQNDGNVTINVQAKRIQGLGTPMDPKTAEVFKKYATEQGLIGPNATLEAWEKYAWTLIGQNSTSTTPAASATTATSGTSTLAQQAQELREMQARSRARQGLL